MTTDAFARGSIIVVDGSGEIPTWMLPPTLASVNTNVMVGQLDVSDVALVIGHHLTGETRVLTKHGTCWIVTGCFVTATR